MAKRIDSATVGVTGAADIKTVNKLHKQLLLALKKNSTIELNVAKAAEFDLAFVQLIESARRSADGKAIRLSEPASGALLEILKRGGFLAGAADNAFWLQQGDC